MTCGGCAPRGFVIKSAGGYALHTSMRFTRRNEKDEDKTTSAAVVLCRELVTA